MGPQEGRKTEPVFASGQCVTRCSLSKAHAERAAKLAADLRGQTIGFADFRIAATALLADAELLAFNRKHFSRIPKLRLAVV